MQPNKAAQPILKADVSDRQCAGPKDMNPEVILTETNWSYQAAVHLV
jgi:hypothetical protein